MEKQYRVYSLAGLDAPAIWEGMRRLTLQDTADRLNALEAESAKLRETIDARTVERCIAECARIEDEYRIARDKEPEESDMYLQLDGTRCGADMCQDALRSLAPESVCEWEWVGDGKYDPKGWKTSCGHRTAKVSAWGFCPFEGCGRRIAVKGE